MTAVSKSFEDVVRRRFAVDDALVTVRIFKEQGRLENNTGNEA